MSAIAKFIAQDDAHKEVKPYIWRGEEQPGLPMSNIKHEEKVLNLTDVRTLAEAAQPQLDTHGFTFVQHKSKTIADVAKDEKNVVDHVLEMEEFVRTFLGVETVIGYNARTRSSKPEVHQRVPVSIEAHIDNNQDNIWPFISHPLTSEERNLIRSGEVRIRVFNLWRPIVDHSEDFPLAVCDPNSIDIKNDIVMADNASTSSMMEASYIIHKPLHKWYWISNQTPDELIVFTQFDTHPPKGVFRNDFSHIPHTAFRNEAARQGCPPRQSIETRFLVLEPAPYSPPVRNATAIPAQDGRKKPYKQFVQNSVVPTEGPAPASKEDRGIQLAFHWRPDAVKTVPTVAAK